jgi:hypothetical protein
MESNITSCVCTYLHFRTLRTSSDFKKLCSSLDLCYQLSTFVFGPVHSAIVLLRTCVLSTLYWTLVLCAYHHTGYSAFIFGDVYSAFVLEPLYDAFIFRHMYSVFVFRFVYYMSEDEHRVLNSEDEHRVHNSEDEHRVHKSEDEHRVHMSEDERIV